MPVSIQYRPQRGRSEQPSARAIVRKIIQRALYLLQAFDRSKGEMLRAIIFESKHATT